VYKLYIYLFIYFIYMNKSLELNFWSIPSWTTVSSSYVYKHRKCI